MLESIEVFKDNYAGKKSAIRVVTETTTVTTDVQKSDAQMLVGCAFDLNHKEALAMLVKIYLEDGSTPAEIQGIVNFTINQFNKDYE